MRILLICLLSFIYSYVLNAHEALTGYKVQVYTTIYDDGSAYRLIEINMDPDAHETIQHKRQFFSRNGYHLSEHSEEQGMVLLASRTFDANSVRNARDEFSEIGITMRGDSVYFSETFFTQIVSEEVKSSDLSNDLSAAKVMMADIKFCFHTVFPGRITDAGSGKNSGDTLKWQYDVEQVFQKPSLKMAGASVIQRGDELSWLTGLIGLLFIVIAGLIVLRQRFTLFARH